MWELSSRRALWDNSCHVSSASGNLVLMEWISGARHGLCQKSD